MKNAFSAMLFAINIAMSDYSHDSKIDILKEGSRIWQEYEDIRAESRTLFGSREILTKYDIGEAGKLGSLRHYISQGNGSSSFLGMIISMVPDGNDWYKIDYIMLPDKKSHIHLHQGIDCLEKKIHQKEPSDECNLYKIGNDKIDQYTQDRLDYINLLALYNYAFSSNEEIKSESEIATEEDYIKYLINHINAIIDEK